MIQHYDVAAVRKAFPAAEHVVYLDSGFQTPLSRPVKEAYERFLREGFETAGPKQIWLNRLEETRAKVATFLGAKPHEIAFTKNTSESMNIAANALPLRSGDKVLMIHGDHPNNAYAFLNLQKKGVEVVFIPMTEIMDAESFRPHIDERTRAISMSHVTFHAGHRFNVESVGELCAQHYVMRFAPLGVFAAMATVITTQGVGVLVTYGKFVSAFYFGLAVLWVIIIGAGSVVLGGSIKTLLHLLRQPMMIAFSTSSSEAAFPKMIEQLMKFGVSERITGFVLPLGYSFNLDGSMMYQTFAALFVAQAFGIEMPITTQIAMLLLLMVTSKGIAGVPRASLVVAAATLPTFGLPAGGLVLLIGIDAFLDMGRTMTNVIGNGVATAVVAKWENELGEPDEEDAFLPTAVAG
jgi:hypothetical protein